jgi:putative sugar O-methyltransferase
VTSIAQTFRETINAPLRLLGLELRRSANSRARLIPRARFYAERSAPSNPQIVVDAKRHLANANAVKCDLPDFGSHWRSCVEHMRADIARISSPIEALHHAQGTVNFDHRSDASGLLMPLYHQLVSSEFPQLTEVLDHMSESPSSVGQSLANLGGRTVSDVFFYHARTLLSCITYINAPQRIIEVGGGYGALARLWLSLSRSPATSYAIIDIPESLFFAECALRQEFGDAIGYFDGIDPGTPVVLVPLCHLPHFARSADVVINTGSMQEMTDEWIDLYMAWLDRVDARYFYSLNYAASPLSNLAESRTFWGPRPSSAWSTRLLNFNIPLLKAISPRNFLEAIYEKTPAKGSLRNWSAHGGMFMSPTVYLEGLDLLRQSLVQDDARTFVTTVIDKMPYIAKELFWIANWLKRSGGQQLQPDVSNRLAAALDSRFRPEY